MIGYSVAHRYCSDCYRAANYRPADYSEQADNFPDRCYSEQHCFVPEFFVVVTVIPVGFEDEDAVCELFFVVVVASLVSFSSFADEVSVSVVLSETVVVVVSTLDSVSSICPQAVSSRLHTAKIVIAFFIVSPR